MKKFIAIFSIMVLLTISFAANAGRDFYESFRNGEPANVWCDGSGGPCLDEVIIQ